MFILASSNISLVISLDISILERSIANSLYFRELKLLKELGSPLKSNYTRKGTGTLYSN